MGRRAGKGAQLAGCKIDEERGRGGTKLARSRDAGRVVVAGRKVGKDEQLAGCKVDEERGRGAQRWQGVRLVGVRD